MLVNTLGKAQFRSARLDSWKSIAEYLDRSLRTVQRWQQRYGLPVHKVGGETGSIFAYTDELDNWMKGQSDESVKREKVSNFQLVADHISPEISGNPDRSSGSADEQSTKRVSDALRMWESLSPENIDAIVRAYQDAVHLNPQNGHALAGLSLSLIAENLIEVFPPSSGYASARIMLKRAQEAGPELIETHCADAWLKMVGDHAWQTARGSFDKILRASPSCRYAMVGRALLCIAESRLQEARKLFAQVADLTPLSQPATAFHIWTEYLARNYKCALMLIRGARACGHFGTLLDVLEAFVSLQIEGPEQQIERLEKRASQPLCPALLQGILAYSYASAGQERKAEDLLTELMTFEIRPAGQFAYPMALIFTAKGDYQSAAEQLSRSFHRGSLWSFGFLLDPLLAPLRLSPHFRLFESRFKYPEQADMGQ